MGKVERARQRSTEAPEGPEDRAVSKGSWVDGGDPRAVSPGGRQQAGKVAQQQEYQVGRARWVAVPPHGGGGSPRLNWG